MTHHHLPYVTDNPFRLLGLPSATSQKEVESACKKIRSSLRRGQRHDVAMARQWGEEQLDTVPDIVQKMAANPVLRSIYRIFWPLDRDCVTGLPKPDEYDGRHPAQIRFLGMFFFTQSAPDATLVGLMPRRWRAFREEASSHIRLRRLLHQEEGCGPQAAEELVSQAWQLAPENIVAADLSWARAMWEADQWEEACAQITVVMKTWAPPARTLDWFVDEADRLALALKAESVGRLTGLAKALNDRVSETIRSDWAEALKEFEQRRPRPVQLRPANDKFSQILSTIKTAVPQAQSIILFSLSEATDPQLEVVAASSPFLPKGVMPPISANHGLLGKALELGQPIQCDNTEKSDIKNFLPEHGVLAAPIGDGSNVLGCLYLGGAAGSFSEEDTGLLNNLLPQIRACLLVDPRMLQPFAPLNLQPELIAALKRRCRIQQFAPAEVILEQGKAVDSYHLIIEGCVEVLTDAQDRPSLLTAGQEFGATSLIDEYTSTSTVRAQDSVTLQVLRKRDFDILCQRFPELEETFRNCYVPPPPPPPPPRISICLAEHKLTMPVQ